MRYLFLIGLFLFSLNNVQAQNDSITSGQAKKNFWKRQIPAYSLIVLGSALNLGDIKPKLQDAFPRTENNWDDYLQYAPIVFLYTFDALGAKTKNSTWQYTKNLILSEITSGIIVRAMKSGFGVTRPNGGTHSFPSGHTTLAFMGATVFFNEFRETEPILAYTAYPIATAVGLLRVTNNWHWVPDVVAGAGLGILFSNIIYHYQPLKNFLNGKQKSENISFYPLIEESKIGFVLIY